MSSGCPIGREPRTYPISRMVRISFGSAIESLRSTWRAWTGKRAAGRSLTAMKRNDVRFAAFYDLESSQDDGEC